MRSPRGPGPPRLCRLGQARGAMPPPCPDDLRAPEPQFLTLEGMSVLGGAVLGMTFSNLSTWKDTGLESRWALWCLWIAGRWGGPRRWPGERGT